MRRIVVGNEVQCRICVRVGVAAAACVIATNALLTTHRTVVTVLLLLLLMLFTFAIVVGRRIPPLLVDCDCAGCSHLTGRQTVTIALRACATMLLLLLRRGRLLLLVLLLLLHNGVVLPTILQ